MTHFVEQYGLIVVFLLIAAESAGVPLPGETALIAASIFASQGHYSIVAVIGVAALAAIIGDNIGYWLGRELGRNFLQRYAIVKRFSDRIVPRAERFFQKHGGKAVFFARFIAGLRVAGAWIAGFSKMTWWRFFAWNAIGGIVWATLVALIAYYFGHAAADAINQYGLAGAGVVAALAILVVVGLHFWNKRMEKRI